MKRLAFSIGILALGFVTAATPARAEFAVVRFADGHCEIWLGSGAAPWLAGLTRIAVTADWWSAQVARDWAITNKVCIL